MSITVPSFTKTYHTSSYPALDSTQPALSTKGKTIILLCGYESRADSSAAHSFAASGASQIVLLGPEERPLLDVKQNIESRYPSTNVHVFVADVSSTESVGVAAHKIRASVGAWDVFVSANRHSGSEGTTLAGADTDEWWNVFELNIKFTHLFAKHFMPKARPNATYISLFSGIMHEEALHTRGQSAQVASQVAVLRLNEHLAAEHPSLRVFNVHDNMGGLVKVTASTVLRLSKDQEGAFVATQDLLGNFCVWLVSPEQDFLRGRLVWCNWDVGELAAKKAEIETNPLFLTPSIGGLPFERTNI